METTINVNAPSVIYSTAVKSTPLTDISEPQRMADPQLRVQVLQPHQQTHPAEQDLR